ncbi:MAG: TetR/AcrR family transcriptional regulator [Lachnospiraceae bacterium]|nr:TetR/AcrR family transcriptional regulator [Lachnospiraceae bacterium]
MTKEESNVSTNTRQNIIKTGTRLFIERGYSTMSISMIAKELNISKGTVTFHFPTKEDILVVLVENLCAYQKRLTNEMESAQLEKVYAYCLELVATMVVCQESPQGKDFIIAAYVHPKTLEIMRKNDAIRLRVIFQKYNPDWKEKEFAFIENIISGIEYGAFMGIDDENSPFEDRIKYNVSSILKLLCVPESERQVVIEKILATDYRQVGKYILENFTDYISVENDIILEDKSIIYK